jgi:hypothetical protein
MTSQNALQTYLTDHMAGSVAASDLAKRGADNNEGPLAMFFADLAREIDTDRRTLDRIAACAGTEPSTLKQAAAVAAERLSRFKIDHCMTGDPELSRRRSADPMVLAVGVPRQRAAGDPRPRC